MKKALTLIEVMVATVILAVVFGGLLATFIGVRRYVNRANQRLVVANLINLQFSNLYDEVRADNWDTGNLQDGLSVPALDYHIDNHDYGYEATSNYQVTDESGSGFQFRRVTIRMDHVAQ